MTTSAWIIVGAAALACLGFVAAGSQPAIDLYSKRYNNLDIDTILNSDRLVRNYVDCLLSRKPCSPEGKELKRLLPEALRTKCGKCSNNQKEAALHVLKNLYTHYPNYYNDLREKWDPSGEYHRKYEEYLRGEQFNAINGGYDQDFGPSERPVFAATSHQNPTPTQRPARNPEGEQNFGLNQPVEEPTFSLSNRFSDDEIETGSAPAASAVSTTNENAPSPPSSATYLPPLSSSVSSPIVGGGTTLLSVVPSSTTTTTLAPANPDVGSSLVGSGSGIDTSRVTASPGTTVVVSSPSPTRSPAPVSAPSHAPTRQPSLIEQLFPPPPSNIPPPFGGSGPFGLGIIERLGNKITNTAEFFAEMVRNTVKRTQSNTKHRNPKKIM